MSDANLNQIPPPTPSTLNMIREVAGYLVSRSPMSTSSADLLKNSVEGFRDQIRMIQSVVASHKMLRMSRLLSAVDMCEEKLTDPEYIKRISNNPKELRQHFALLKEVEQADLEFLRLQASDKSEKEGFSSDPKQQFNFFFNEKEKKTPLPADMTVDERRKTRDMLDNLLNIVSGKPLPKPPTVSSRVVDAPFIIKEKEEVETDDGSDGNT
jgi:hypothetical protein